MYLTTPPEEPTMPDILNQAQQALADNPGPADVGDENGANDQAERIAYFPLPAHTTKGEWQPHVMVGIYMFPDESTLFRWSDGLEGHAEAYPSVALAFMRLAALEECRASGWDKAFDMSVEQHTVYAQGWLDQAAR